MTTMRHLVRVVSGGQTGVDRAALDAAIACGLACGGWLPRGRRTEDGPLAEHYPLRETRRWRYSERTRLNVQDSDATLILTRGCPTGGTALTAAVARRLGKPNLIVDLAAIPDPGVAGEWLVDSRIEVLNVAGPRESTSPGVYREALAFLTRLLGAPAQR